MKTAEEIFNTEEEAFKAVDAYVMQEAIAFLFFVLNEDVYRIDTTKWKHLSGDTIYNNEELYSLYLQSKNK